MKLKHNHAASSVVTPPHVPYEFKGNLIQPKNNKRYRVNFIFKVNGKRIVICLGLGLKISI